MQRILRFEPLWQDRDIRFDASPVELALRPGERVIEAFARVEDTKGNTGEIGKLIITNLRLIWQSLAKPRINLTIGFNNITTITSRMIHTKLRGKNEALYMMTKVNGTRYEFIFIRLDPTQGVGSREMVELVGQVCKAYVSTRLYRDLRLRSAILSPSSKQLKILPSEQIYNTINGVWNLSSDQGNLGTMYLTNVRVVWHANMNELFNISLPFIQIRNIKVRESKFGLALVIESSESSGGYVLGFRVDPVEKLNSVFEELNNLYVVHSASPDFGVHSYLQYSIERGILGPSGASETETPFETGDANPGLVPNIQTGGEQNQEQGAGGGPNMAAMIAALAQQATASGIDSPSNAAAAAGPFLGFGTQFSFAGDLKEITGNNNSSNGSSKTLSNYEEVLGEEGGDGGDTGGSGGGRGHGYGDAVAAYLAEGESGGHRGGGGGGSSGEKQHDWVYVPNLGLSIERIKAGYTMESLWEVVETA